MKNIYILLSILACTVGAVSAKAPRGTVDVSSVSIDRKGDAAEVSMLVGSPRGAVKSGYTMVLVPVISNGEYRVSLPAVIIRGGVAKRAQKRHEWVSQTPVDYAGATEIRPGRSTSYSESVEFQPWMEGATLTMEGTMQGCCSSSDIRPVALAESIMPDATPIEAAELPTAPRTTGDMLARTFDFVMLDDGEDRGEGLYDADRENALIVYYRQGSNAIQPEYGQNRLILTNLVAAVNTILSSPDSDVSRIVVAGFSSPEGTYALNDRLAWERASQVKEYVTGNTAITDNRITLYNGSEDWRGLRSLVEASSLADREQIIDIIDNVPAVSYDGRTKPRLERLRQLNGGASYQYMYDHFFPQLRNGAFIRVYYKNTK